MEFESRIKMQPDDIYYGDVYAGEGMVDESFYKEEQGKNINSNVALWITIGVCIVIGIILGIILGRRSAMK